MFQTRRRVALAATLALCFGIFAAAGIDVAAAAGDRQDRATVVDLNHAGAEELTAVPGIGETMARRIVEWRDEHGPFRRVEDLMKIKGIGEKSFQKMRPYVRVSQVAKNSGND